MYRNNTKRTRNTIKVQAGSVMKQYIPQKTSSCPPRKRSSASPATSEPVAIEAVTNGADPIVDTVRSSASPALTTTVSEPIAIEAAANGADPVDAVFTDPIVDAVFADPDAVANDADMVVGLEVII